METVITARDYGSTLEMLERANAQPHVFGVRVGRGMVRKAAAAGIRAHDLARFLTRIGKPAASLGASRPAAVAAWQMKIPSFCIGDYEYANASVYRLTGTTILHPGVIDQKVFRRRGLRADQLVAFDGLKEDLTFAGMDVNAIEPHDLGRFPQQAARVLFRPPSETSHYYKAASRRFARATLELLASADAVVVFSPRERAQVSLLEGLRWRHEPVILERPVPFVSLLKSVDLVVCSGGTMLREAAYLGIPSYSIFQSEIGAVDRWLERIGRAKLLASPDDLDKIELRRRGPLERLNSNPELLEQLVAVIASESRESLLEGRAV